jgi:hypothetical protein
MRESYCGDIWVSGVRCHGIIDGNTITLHEQKNGVAWDGHERNK